ncbi:MAG TPA: TonB-dependent receptor [Anaeromyxobacteraceae bacterium]|nr:TonB-dependent receptor [Anaeromyxobacteraceae bacterium]
MPIRDRLGAALLAASLVIGLELAGTARAQESTKVEIASVDLESLLDLSVEAVSLRQERSSEASASVFVLTQDDLRRQGFRTLDEVLRSVPGLFVFTDGFYPQVGVRGMGSLGDFTTRILILVDGHPMNNSLAIGESYIGRDLPVPLAAVRRVEVVKGPVGSLYGPTAYLAVVNLVTTGGAPRNEVAAYGEAAQGAVRGGNGTAVASGQTKDLSWLVSGEGYGTRGLDESYPELTPQTIVGRNQAQSYQSYARLSWRGLAANVSCGDFQRGLASAPWSSLVGDSRNTLENRTCFAQLSLSRDLSRTVAIDARVAYDHFQYWDEIAYPPPPDGLGIFKDYGLDQWISGDVHATWQPLSKTRLVAGSTVEAHDTIQHSYGLNDPTVGVGVIAKSFKTINSYLLLEQALLPSLTLHGGLTFYVHELFGDRVTPKVALVWHPTQSDVVKALWSEGFRAPTAGEAYFQDGSSYLANPQLKPELARSLEIAYERRFSSIASVALSAFQNEYSNLITIVTVPVPGVTDPQTSADYRQMSVNAGAMRLRGADLALTLRWGDVAQAWGGVSVQSLDQVDRSNFPSWTGNLAVSSRALWHPLVLSLNGSAIAPRAKAPTSGAVAGSVPAAMVLNAFAALDVPRVSGLTVELGVQNLLDAAAVDPVSGDFAPITAMSQPARTIRAGVRYRF